MPIIDKFDLVLAIHVLHYVKTKRELLKLCKKIYNNTSSEGKFIAMIMNPDYDFKKQEYYPKKEYLSTFNKLEAPNEEENYKLIMTSKSSRIELDITYFSKNTYKQILQSAGFRKVNFHNLIVSKEGINKFGLDFWKEHLENPKSLLIECLP
jgi:ubiquinone/menaquinone biosynthesis C-methylase UbiE